MKKSALLLLLGACFCSAFAQDYEECDSVADNAVDLSHRVVNPDSVVIDRSNGMVSVRIYGEDGNHEYSYAYSQEMPSDSDETVSEHDDWNFDLPFVDKLTNHSSRSRFAVSCGGFGFGFVNAIDCPPMMNTKMASSYEIFCDRIIAVSWSPMRNGTSLRLGLGLDWKNFRMTGNTRFVKDGKFVNFGEYPPESDPKFSRLKVFALTMPVTFTQKFGKGFSFSAGAVVNFNTHASMKTKYINNNDEVTLANCNIHQRKVTVDVMGQFNFKAIGVYIKYSPMSVLDPEFGPDFKCFSTGLTLFY